MGISSTNLSNCFLGTEESRWKTQSCREATSSVLLLVSVAARSLDEVLQLVDEGSSSEVLEPGLPLPPNICEDR